MAPRGSSWVSQLAKKSTSYKLAVLGIIMAVLGFIYWQFMYSSLKEEQVTLRTQRNNLIKKVDDLKKKEETYRQRVHEMEALEQQMKKNALSLPSSSELPAFFLNIQKQAAAAGVTLRSWQRLKEVPVETYVKVPVSIEVSGTFYQINNYFKLLHEVDRIITVEQLKLGGVTLTNDEAILTAKFRASTFRKRDLPPDTNLADEGAEGAGDAGGGKVGAATRAREDQVEKAGGAEDGAGQGSGPTDAPSAGIERLTKPGAGAPE
jgi:Tfp pilus assembly protein PilO